jgi:hypothetical protein
VLAKPQAKAAAPAASATASKPVKPKVPAGEGDWEEF